MSGIIAASGKETFISRLAYAGPNNHWGGSFQFQLKWRKHGEAKRIAFKGTGYFSCRVHPDLGALQGKASKEPTWQLPCLSHLPGHGTLWDMYQQGGPCPRPCPHRTRKQRERTLCFLLLSSVGLGQNCVYFQWWRNSHWSLSSWKWVGQLWTYVVWGGAVVRRKKRRSLTTGNAARFSAICLFKPHHSFCLVQGLLPSAPPACSPRSPGVPTIATFPLNSPLQLTPTSLVPMRI